MRTVFLVSDKNVSINRKIFGASFSIGLLTLVVNFFTFFKEVLIARFFGISSELDVFLLAVTVIGIPVAVILYSLQSSFIPVFIVVSSDRKHAQRVLTATTVGALAAIASITVLLIALLPQLSKLFGYGFSPHQHALLESYIIVLLPVVFLNGLNFLSRGVLNAGKRFRLTSIAPAMTPILIIIILFILGTKSSILALAWALVAGAAFEFVLLQIALEREGYRLITFDQKLSMSPEVKRVFTQTAALIGGSFIIYGTTLVDQSMASTLDSGSIAALSYGNKVPSLIYSLFATALGTAVLPYFSEMVAKNDWSGCRHTLKKYSQLCLLTLIPLVVLIYYCSGVLIRLIFQRGSFDVQASELVVGVQQAYLLQVPSYVVAILAVRLISASGHNHILSLVAILSFSLNIIFNWWFMNIFGAMGIALSTSAVQLVTTVTLFYIVTRLINGKITIRHETEQF